MDQLEAIVARLSADGWAVVPDFLDASLTAGLCEDCGTLSGRGEFRAAAIGSGAQRQTRNDVRADEIFWLEEPGASEPQRRCLERFEQLRLVLNRELQLGLFEFECHFARYAPGAFYKKHLDQFLGDGRRRLSTVLYLNQDWQPQDGGELRLYLDKAENADYVDVVPNGGTLAVFLSDRFPHEVLPARHERLSLAGWFKTR